MKGMLRPSLLITPLPHSWNVDKQHNQNGKKSLNVSQKSNLSYLQGLMRPLSKFWLSSSTMRRNVCSDDRFEKVNSKCLYRNCLQKGSKSLFSTTKPSKDSCYFGWEKEHNKRMERSSNQIFTAKLPMNTSQELPRRRIAVESVTARARKYSIRYSNSSTKLANTLTTGSLESMSKGISLTMELVERYKNGKMWFGTIYSSNFDLTPVDSFYHFYLLPKSAMDKRRVYEKAAQRLLLYLWEHHRPWLSMLALTNRRSSQTSERKSVLFYCQFAN